MKNLFVLMVLTLLIAITLSVIPGGWTNLVIDKNVERVSTYAAKQINSGTNSIYHHKLIDILEAKSQVVAGIKYKVVITIQETTCKKNKHSFEDAQNCDLQDSKNPKTCNATIWEQPWLNSTKLLDFSCNEAKRIVKRSVKIDEITELHRILFDSFIEKYQKKYSDDYEKEKRFRIFRANLKKIKELNQNEQGTATYGITQFTDLNDREFRKYYLGFRPDLAQSDNILNQAKVPSILIPESFDWRHYNVVSEVKNQQQCGSCWAFSTTGNIEGQWAIKKKKLLSLSEQELVDCDKIDQGCNGGLPSNAYKEIIRLGGLETEKEYPYEAEDEKCAFKKSDARVYINSSVSISKNETEMAAWLVKNGPISIGINANAMQFYFGGISHPWKFLCNPNNLDHGVLIVGYGVHSYPLFNRTIPFWSIKNSWGASWGEQGYYRVYRGDGTCGLNQMATSSVVD